MKGDSFLLPTVDTRGPGGKGGRAGLSDICHGPRWAPPTQSIDWHAAGSSVACDGTNLSLALSDLTVHHRHALRSAETSEVRRSPLLARHMREAPRRDAKANGRILGARGDASSFAATGRLGAITLLLIIVASAPRQHVWWCRRERVANHVVRPSPIPPPCLCFCEHLPRLFVASTHLRKRHWSDGLLLD